MTLQHAERVLDASGFQAPAQKLVLVDAAFRADRRGVIRLSQAEVAAETALSRRTVLRWMDAFMEVGLLQRLGHGRYELHLDVLDPEQAPPSDVLRWAADSYRLRPAPSHPEARAEETRLRTLRREDQGIVYTPEGWPHLVDL